MVVSLGENWLGKSDRHFECGIKCLLSAKMLVEYLYKLNVRKLKKKLF